MSKPKFLYHATYRPLLRKIQKEGLGGKSSKPNWEDSKPGVIYWSIDSDVAESYADSAEEVPEEWLDNIVVLKCKYSDFDETKLFVDENVRSDNPNEVTIEYHGGPIPWEKLSEV